MVRKLVARALFGSCSLVALLSACPGSDEATPGPGSGGTGGSGALGTGGLGISGTLGGGGLGIAGAPNIDGGLAGFGAFAGAGGGGGNSGGSGTGGAPAGGTAGAGATGGGSGGVPVTCVAPMANCNPAPDCDTNLQQAPNNCLSASDLGTHCGDDVCDVIFACWPVTWKPAKAAKGRGSKWFVAGSLECSSCVAETVGLAKLRSPPGTNYDLYVYENCGQLVASSKKPAGEDDIIAVEQKDVSGIQAFLYWIEVRWVSGNTCEDWQLQVYRSGCL